MLRPFPSSMRAAANTPAEPVGACVARFPTGSSLPRYQGGLASASYPFEACSAFTRVAARMVAKPPLAARCVGVLQTMSLPPSSAPTATGWSDSCRAGFAPAEEWRLFTAHLIKGVMLPSGTKAVAPGESDAAIQESPCHPLSRVVVRGVADTILALPRSSNPTSCSWPSTYSTLLSPNTKHKAVTAPIVPGDIV